MGMYDSIRCEIPLPDGAVIGELQTKDFDCEMVEHLITSDGRLMLERIDEIQEVPEAERPYPGAKGILGICGSIRIIKSKHQSDFHGVLNFYGHGKSGEWHEYNAKFTDGRLVEIQCVTEK